MWNPVYPHDGTTLQLGNTMRNATITLNGVGAFLGIPKVNGGECTVPEDAPESITYEIYSYDDNAPTVMVKIGSGYWTYKMVPRSQQQIDWRTMTDKDILSILEMRPEMVMYGIGHYDSISFSYYNSFLRLRLIAFICV